MSKAEQPLWIPGCVKPPQDVIDTRKTKCNPIAPPMLSRHTSASLLVLRGRCYHSLVRTAARKTREVLRTLYFGPRVIGTRFQGKDQGNGLPWRRSNER